MKTLIQVAVAVAILASLGACSNEKACEDNTLLLTVDLTHAPALVDRLTINVLAEGFAPTSSSVTVAAMAPFHTVAIDFPSGYPVGKRIAVDVLAHTAAGASAAGSASVIAPQGCGTLTVVVGDPGANAAADGGGALAGDAGISPISDGGAMASECVVGALVCRERIVAACGADGVWVETEECAGTCEAGVCMGNCLPGMRQCAEGGVQTCTEAAQWSAPTVCAGECSGGVCTLCTANQKRCNGEVLETCDATGTWGSPLTCDHVCLENACAGECKPGVPNRCEGKTLQACSPNGTWTALETCDFICAIAGCRGECEPGALRCNAAAVEECDGTGIWKLKTNCEFSCNQNVCTPKPPGLPGVAPKVTSIAPADGTKVRENETITIQFSEEMNPASVEAAFKPATAGSAAPKFRWSPDKTVLTVDPTFTYPAGNNPSSPRSSYVFSLTIEAKDANGEALDSPVGRSYPLAFRRITTVIPFTQKDAADNLVSGHVGETYTGKWTFMQAGFSNSQGRYDAFATFFIDALPPNIVKIEAAHVASQVETVSGVATGLGNLRLGDLIFPIPLAGNAFGASTVRRGELISASSLWKQDAKFQYTVTNALTADYNNRVARANRSQYRFFFDGKPPAGTYPLIRLFRPQTNLKVVYLLD